MVGVVIGGCKGGVVKGLIEIKIGGRWVVNLCVAIWVTIVRLLHFYAKLSQSITAVRFEYVCYF